MNSACDPRVESGSNPEAVDAAGDDAKQPPLDVLSKEIAAGTVETKSSAINNSMAYNKLHNVAYRPRKRDTAGDRYDKRSYKAVNKRIENTAVPVRELGESGCCHRLLICRLLIHRLLRLCLSLLRCSANRTNCRVGIKTISAILTETHLNYPP